MGAILDTSGIPILTTYGETLLNSLPTAGPITTIIGNAQLAVAEVNALAASQSGPQWGLFNQDGSSIFISNSVTIVSLEHRKEFTISDFPIEDGGFASYNKVRRPYDVRMIMAQDGAREDKAAFLTALDIAVNSLNIIVALAPEVYYPSVNLVDYQYRREQSRGANIIVVEASLREVRIVAPATYVQNNDNSNNVTDSSAANQQDGGTRSPATPTTQQQNETSAQAVKRVQSGTKSGDLNYSGGFA